MELIDIPLIRLRDYRQEVSLHNFCDLHVGAEGCDERQLKKDVRTFQDKRKKGEPHFWFLGGDAINAIGPKDKRHDASAVAKRFKDWEGDDLFRQQVIAVEEIFAPIREWGLFIGAGNHESTISAGGEYNPSRDLAQRLDLPYAGYSAGFRLRVEGRNSNNRISVNCFWHHGYGAARTRGGKANMGAALLSIVNVDLYFTGHVHEPISFPDEELSLTRRGKLRLEARDKLVVIGASYLKTYPTIDTAQRGGQFNPEHKVQYDYGERKGYRPAVIGHTGATIRLEKSKDSIMRAKLRMADFR